MELSPGLVQVQSQLYSEDGVLRNADTITNDANTFSKGMSRVAAATKFAAIQIINPAGSGITAFIDQVIIGSGINTNVGILTSDTAFANNPQNVDCLRAGQTDGSCEVDYNDQAVSQNGEWLNVLTGAYRGIPYIFDTPIQLDEGKGIAVLQTSAANWLAVTYILREFTN